ncbi:MAG: AAA family ATPase [Bacteroidetes bacterium]|nr:AAA family ATPase [Bacteroidota bacterium]
MQKQETVILLAEVTGFQALAEDPLPDDLSRIMNDLHNLFESSTQMHHGTINRFSGDSVLVVFDDTKRKAGASHALDTAFEIKELLPEKIQLGNPDQQLSLKLAITSGQVIATSIGTGSNHQTTLVGEPLNHASRICQFADQNQILVDENVFESSKDYFEFQSLEPIPLKGGAETLAIYEPLKKKRKKLDLKARGERKILSEMVGRTREMEQLEGSIRNLVAGKGSIFNIVGKAGIGKSRLIAEIKVQPILENVMILEGRALSTGQNLSFHPIINLIKSWAEITEDDAPALSSEKVYQGINKIAPEQADEIYAFLATMMGLPLEGKHKERVQGIEGEALEKLILKNLRDLIIAATKDKPRIYLIEDMHWADSSSLTFFESLYKLSQNHPVMFINVMRPGYKETGDYILKYLVDKFPGDHTTIHINSLEEKESDNLIKNLLRETPLPGEIQKMIIRKTEGNPFFIEEIIRSFIDEEIIEVKDGHFVVTEKINDANIPETINEAILSRVDKLDEKTRELLNTASVMGRNFYYKVLEEATDTIEELDERLAYLSEIQLISENKKKQEIEYLFKHALAQQLTYDSILRESRKDLHLKIARSIEKVFAENLQDFYGTLAAHYEEAGDTIKTEDYLLKAGRSALDKGASAEAITFFKKALSHYTIHQAGKIDKQKIADLEEMLATALFINGQQIECVNYFEKVQAFYGLRFPKKKLSKIGSFFINFLRLLWLIWFSNEKRKRNATEYEKKLEKIYIMKGHALISFDGKRMFFEYINITKIMNRAKISSLRYGIGNLVNLGALFIWTGKAIKLGQALHNLAQKNLNESDAYSWITVKYQKEVNTYFTGYMTEPFTLDENIFNKGLAIGEYWQPMAYYVFSSLVQMEKGEKETAEKCLDYVQRVGDAFDNNYCYAQYYRCMSNYLLKNREIDHLIANSTEGVDYVSKTDHHGMLLMICCSRSIGFSMQGDQQKAKENLDKAEDLLIRFSIKLHESHCLIARCYYEKELILKQTNEKERSLASRHFLKTSNKSVKTAKLVLSHLTEAYRLQAEACWFCKHHKKAKQAFRKSMEAANKFGAKLELSRTYFELGKFLSDPKVKYNKLNGKPAEFYLEKAKTMFEEMDLQWDLDKHKKASNITPTS